MSSLLEIGEVLLEHCHITARSFSIKVGIKVCGGWNGLLFAPTIFLVGKTCAKAKGSEKKMKILRSDNPTSFRFQKALDMGNNHTNTRYTTIDSIQ